MNIPIRILIGEIGSVGTDPKWGDIIDSWESYAQVWNQSNNLNVDPSAAPILDMFGDEGVSIKTEVKKLSDPKKLFTALSRSFSVPASKKNNRIFKHYYNIDIQNGLDSRELIPAKILMNNRTYKEGNIRVDSVRMSGGVAVHYKLTFIGKLSELSRRIGVDKLNTLDFTDMYKPTFDFRAEMENVTPRNLMFPVASRAERFLVDTYTPSLGIENARNIAYSSGVVETDYGIREQDLVGALNVGHILDRIQSKYSFTFNGAFTADYIQEMYLWLHQTDKKRDDVLNSAEFESYAWNTAGSLTENPNFNLLNNGFIIDNNAEALELGYARRRYHIKIKCFFSSDATIYVKQNGNIIREITENDVYTDTIVMGGNVQGVIFQLVAESGTSQTIDAQIYIQEYTKDDDFFTISRVSTITAEAVVGTARTYSVQENLPDMTIMDFLSSLFKQFNIVAEVDADLNITTKHFDHFMSDGEVKDITKYVDAEAYDVFRPNLYSSMVMGYEEPMTALEVGYKAVNGRKYGEISYELVGQTGARLSGDSYKMEVKNQRMPVEALFELGNNSKTFYGVCYTLFGDVSGSEQSIKPSFTYLARANDFTSGWNIRPLAAKVTNTSTTTISNYVMPCNDHVTGLREAIGLYNTIGLYFGEENTEYKAQSNYAFDIAGSGLWNSFYRGTTAMMFDEDKRKVQMQAYLPQGVVLKLKLSDTLLISNKFYNINSIDTNYLSGLTKLELTLVGDSKLDYFKRADRSILASDPSQFVYITYLDAVSGHIKNRLIAPNTPFVADSIGGVIGRSGDVDVT